MNINNTIKLKSFIQKKIIQQVKIFLDQTVCLHVIIFLIHGVSLFIIVKEFANNSHCTVSLYTNKCVAMWGLLRGL